MNLFFDVETAGKPRNWRSPASDTFNWPRMVQIAWQLYDDNRRLVESADFIIKPDGYEIPYEAERIHGISTERAREEGQDLKTVLEAFRQVIDKAEYIIAHNMNLCENVVGAEFYRKDLRNNLELNPERYCLMQESTYFCKLPGKDGRYKWPSMQEIYQKVFGARYADAHQAQIDVQACANCFYRLIDMHAIELD